MNRTPLADAPRRVYTVEEAAGLLGISRGTGYELARRGELPGARRLGGRIIVVRAELDRYLAGEPPAERPAP
jgi:excisionase family DNA binding protein